MWRGILIIALIVLEHVSGLGQEKEDSRRVLDHGEGSPEIGNRDDENGNNEDSKQSRFIVEGDLLGV